MFNVLFPGLAELLLSAAYLVYLDLSGIPGPGYIQPKVTTTNLSALTPLESLRLNFRYPRPRLALESQRLPAPPLTRSIPPSKIGFKGASEYLEILTRIDAPRLDQLHITFNQNILDTPQLFQFISRRPIPRAPERAISHFIPRPFLSNSDHRHLTTMYSACKSHVRRQIGSFTSLEQVCTSSLPPLSTLEDLYIFEDRGNLPRWQDDVENTLWLKLLHPFATVKNLLLC